MMNYQIDKKGTEPTKRIYTRLEAQQMASSLGVKQTGFFLDMVDGIGGLAYANEDGLYTFTPQEQERGKKL